MRRERKREREKSASNLRVFNLYLDVNQNVELVHRLNSADRDTGRQKREAVDPSFEFGIQILAFRPLYTPLDQSSSAEWCGKCSLHHLCSRLHLPLFVGASVCVRVHTTIIIMSIVSFSRMLLPIARSTDPDHGKMINLDIFYALRCLDPSVNTAASHCRMAFIRLILLLLLQLLLCLWLE